MADPTPPALDQAPLVPPIVAATEPSPTFALPSEAVYVLVCSWKGKKLDVTVVESDTVGDLKGVLFSLTEVPPARQKIVGLVKGKLPGDEAEVVSLGLVQPGGGPKQFMMVSRRACRARARSGAHALLALQIGTPEGEEHKEMGPPVQRDAELDVDYTAMQAAANQAAQGVRNRCVASRDAQLQGLR